MRILIVLIIILSSASNFAIQSDTSAIDAYEVIGDSVFLADGTNCHIENFISGRCEIENSWWDINYLSFWTGLLIPFVFFGYIAITVKRKINKRKSS